MGNIFFRAHSSVVERVVDIDKVPSSILGARTTSPLEVTEGLRALSRIALAAWECRHL